MNLSLKIAFRYLFGKKTVNAINIITSISILGIAIGSAALILILSVFNGFEDLIYNSLNAFNPEIEISPVKGKMAKYDNELIAKLESIESIDYFSFVLEEVAYFQFDNNRTVGSIKGVDKNYNKVNNIDKLLVSGEYKLESNNVDFGVLGAGIAGRLGVSTNEMINPIIVYILKSDAKSMMEANYKKANIMPAGRFSVPDEEYKYIIVSLDLAQYLLQADSSFSSIEVKSKGNIQTAKNDIIKTLGDNYKVQDRLEQEEELRRIINIERWASYAIAIIILLLLTFNIIGSLWIIVIDKKKDISVLQAMGADKNNIRRIFLYSGLLISIIGLIIGILLALLMYFLQVNYGIIGFSPDSYIDAYPIKLKFIDFIIVAITVLIIGFFVAIIPALKAGKISAYIREE
ncbi:MAG: FtsX-like permease family protein [Saprospiraceae bacterium]